MNAIHTPGPWLVAYDRSVRPEADEWITIAQQYDGRDGCILPKDQQKANAHLIAASPRMLDALRVAQMCLIGYTHRNEVIDNAIKEVTEAIHQATTHEA